MAFTPTDLPEPVVPATNKCGILPKSTTTGSPAISEPNTIVNGDEAFLKSSQAITSLKRTISRCLLGSSKPMTDFPGITSTTRTLIADNERAKSFDKLEILLTLTPGANSNSNRVITGPGCTATTLTCTPKSSNLASTKRLVSSNSSWVTGFSALSGLSSKSIEGIP